MFFVHTREEFKNATIIGHFGLFLRKIRSWKSHDYRDSIIFEKLFLHNNFRPHENEKPAFSNFSGLKTGFLRVLENLESPGILFWHFPGLESPGKKATGPGKFWKSVKLNKMLETSALRWS